MENRELKSKTFDDSRSLCEYVNTRRVEIVSISSMQPNLFEISHILWYY